MQDAGVQFYFRHNEETARQAKVLKGGLRPPRCQWQPKDIPTNKCNGYGGCCRGVIL
jgi:hypothetical protein